MRRIRTIIVYLTAAAIGGWLGWILEPAINAWLFTLRKTEPEPWDEPGGGW